MDWLSRFVLSWELSVTMDVSFCLDALRRSLSLGTPEIFNSDQGSQFTSAAFTGVLLGVGVRISMDGRGRAYDNIFTERLWRSVKYEEVYRHDYETPTEALYGIGNYFTFDNHARPHQSLKWRTPAEVYGVKPTPAESRWLKERLTQGGRRLWLRSLRSPYGLAARPRPQPEESTLIPLVARPVDGAGYSCHHHPQRAGLVERQAAGPDLLDEGSRAVNQLSSWFNDQASNVSVPRSPFLSSSTGPKVAGCSAGQT